MSLTRAHRALRLRSRLETRLLTLSIVLTALVAASGIVIGLLSGSMSILFDGMFSIIDAVMGMVTLTVAKLLVSEGNRRYQFGYWHFEPLVLGLQSCVLVLLYGYAFFNAVMAVLAGGTEIEFGLAVIYAAVVAVVCFAMYLVERRANARIESALLGLEAHSWLMSGLITSALLVAFVAASAMKGTAYERYVPYVDPAILAVLALLLLPIPLLAARRAFAEIFGITPPAYDADVREIVAEAVGRYGFASFTSYVAKVGRARFIEIYIVVPPGHPIRDIAEFDRIRHELGDAIGDPGPERWLTIVFTGDPSQT
ncbi:cation transporter [Polymorphobacter arshaanensis]|uniref:Cation transporter n=1 Tax=Glacieibacterium arshaanense TaxID=2511025 RepID=A0A4Y9ENP4_9SPHN|nr:cation transporter [Polymorphobacter arshaanensis]TFU03672.1 cation transporter [Polymorphobacter arshaanensis]